MPHIPSRLEAKTRVRLSGVHPSGKFQLSDRVSFRAESRRIPEGPRARRFMALRSTDSTNARCLASEEIEVHSITKPAQFVTRLGVDVGLPVSELTLISQ